LFLSRFFNFQALFTYSEKQEALKLLVTRSTFLHAFVYAQCIRTDLK
jgi:hypothetical protein